MQSTIEIIPSQPKQQNEIDSLTKMFQSACFTLEMLMPYFRKHRANEGVIDLLINKLYSYKWKDIQFYLPQLCYIIISRESDHLFNFLLQQSVDNAQSYIKILCLINAYGACSVKDKAQILKVDMLERCVEMSFVNGEVRNRSMHSQTNALTIQLNKFGDADEQLKTLIFNKYLEKEAKSNFNQNAFRFINNLIKCSLALKAFPPEEQDANLQKQIQKMNQWLARQRKKAEQESQRNPFQAKLLQGIIFPFSSSQFALPKFDQYNDTPPIQAQPENILTETSNQIVYIQCDLCKCFNTRKRVPYRLVVETIDVAELISYQRNDQLTHAVEIQLSAEFNTSGLIKPNYVNYAQDSSSSKQSTNYVSEQESPSLSLAGSMVPFNLMQDHIVEKETILNEIIHKYKGIEQFAQQSQKEESKQKIQQKSYQSKQKSVIKQNGQSNIKHKQNDDESIFKSAIAHNITSRSASEDFTHCQQQSKGADTKIQINQSEQNNDQKHNKNNDQVNQQHFKKQPFKKQKSHDQLKNYFDNDKQLKSNKLTNRSSFGVGREQQNQHKYQNNIDFIDVMIAIILQSGEENQNPIKQSKLNKLLAIKCEMLKQKEQQQNLQNANNFSIPELKNSEEQIEQAQKNTQQMSKSQSPLAQLSKEQAHGPWDFLWADKLAEIKKFSPYGHFPSYMIRSVIVKGGDDLRQEVIAMQIIKICQSAFQQNTKKLWLRPYEIIVVSATAGIIEYIPDTISLDQLKKKYPGVSLYEFFQNYFDQSLEEAQKNFVESLAGYSLIQYILQIKDRHNGNILLDNMGHIIHIDFGFMLCLNPGGVNFETAPFKLTHEYMEIICPDQNNDMFNYFKMLMLQGFLELRKHADIITFILESMIGSGLPCLDSSNFDLNQFKLRLLLNCTDKEIDKLIYSSQENWWTVQYDKFQKMSNGIMP